MLVHDQSPVQEIPEAALAGVKRTIGSEVSAALRSMGGVRNLHGFAAALPVFFELEGEPYSLRLFQPFEELCTLRQPQTWMIKGGRQIGKTQFIVSSNTLVATISHRPPLRLMFVCPLQKQVDRLSQLTMHPFIETSPVRPLLVGKGCKTSVRLRTFPNRALAEFAYASTSMDRIRGAVAHALILDELQGFDEALIPPILMVTAATYAKGYGWIRYTGTPLTTNNPIEHEWLKSSQAEWFIKCDRCGKWNIPSLEFDLEHMLGPVHDGIGPEEAGGVSGLICRHCSVTRHGTPLRPGRIVRPGEEYIPGYHGAGQWVHRNVGIENGAYDKEKDRRWRYPGYHIPQVIMKMHYGFKSNWSKIILQRDTWEANQFQNEVLGESCEVGGSLFDKPSLVAACDLGFPNDSRYITPKLKAYLEKIPEQNRILAVDWGGGSLHNEERMTSYTKIALCCLRPGRANGIEVDIPWGIQLFNPHAHIQENQRIIELLAAFRCGFLANDITGGHSKGRVGMLIQSGFPVECIVNVQYVSSTNSFMTFRNATNLLPYPILNVGRTRLLTEMAYAIKERRVHFFDYDYISPERPGLVADFLNLAPEMYSRPEGEAQFIRKRRNTSDDFAHASSIGCAAHWFMNKELPRLGWRNKTRLDIPVVESPDFGFSAWDINAPAMI